MHFSARLLAAAFSGSISEGYFRLRKREGMGLGDVKMMLMAGAFLGLKRTVLTILLGSILGSIIGVAFIAIRRKGTRLRASFRHVSWRRRADRGLLRHAVRELVYVAAESALKCCSPPFCFLRRRTPPRPRHPPRTQAYRP